MALFNKLFSRDKNPYELNGRWYKIRLESATIVASKSDMEILPIIATQSVHITNPKYVAIDYVAVPDAGAALTNTSYHRVIDFRTNGEQYLTLPAASYLGSYTLYVYCIKVK